MILHSERVWKRLFIHQKPIYDGIKLFSGAINRNAQGIPAEGTISSLKLHKYMLFRRHSANSVERGKSFLYTLVQDKSALLLATLGSQSPLTRLELSRDLMKAVDPSQPSIASLYLFEARLIGGEGNGTKAAIIRAKNGRFGEAKAPSDCGIPEDQ